MIIFSDEITANKIKTSKDVDVVTSVASNKIWRLLRTNSSAVHLHVLVLRDVPVGQKSGTFQFSTVHIKRNKKSDVCVHNELL